MRLSIRARTDCKMLVAACIGLLFLASAPIQAATITFSQTSIASALDLSPASELFGPGASGVFPYTEINGAIVTATSLVGLPITLAALGGDPSKLTLSFGSLSENPIGPSVLDLTFFDNGATTSLAIEEYTGSAVATLFNDGTPVATGTISFIRTETAPGIPLLTTGFITGELTSALGEDPSIFNEIFSASGGSLNGVLDSFLFTGNTELLDGAIFVSTGTFTLIPEPSTAFLLAAGLVGLAISGRRRL